MPNESWPYGDILKADKMSMVNSLKMCVPFWDQNVFAVARHLPTKYLVTRQANQVCTASGGTKAFAGKRGCQHYIGKRIAEYLVKERIPDRLAENAPHSLIVDRFMGCMKNDSVLTDTKFLLKKCHFSDIITPSVTMISGVAFGTGIILSPLCGLPQQTLGESA